jgi:hypothetical protein
MSINESDGEEIEPGVGVVTGEEQQTVGCVGAELYGYTDLPVGHVQLGECYVSRAHEAGILHRDVCSTILAPIIIIFC